MTLGQLADTVVPGGDPQRITVGYAESPQWSQDLVPMLLHLGPRSHAAAEALDAVEQVFVDLTLPEEQAQPLLDVRRARRRLVEQAKGAAAFVEGPDSAVSVGRIRSASGAAGGPRRCARRRSRSRRC